MRIDIKPQHSDTPQVVPPLAVKKGAVNTPSVNSFFANENGGFEFIFKNRRASLLPISATINQLPQLRFFYFPYDSQILILIVYKKTDNSCFRINYRLVFPAPRLCVWLFDNGYIHLFDIY
jgi:hypothetical protein